MKWRGKPLTAFPFFCPLVVFRFKNVTLLTDSSWKWFGKFYIAKGGRVSNFNTEEKKGFKRETSVRNINSAIARWDRNSGNNIFLRVRRITHIRQLNLNFPECAFGKFSNQPMSKSESIYILWFTWVFNGKEKIAAEGIDNKTLALKYLTHQATEISAESAFRK